MGKVGLLMGYKLFRFWYNTPYRLTPWSMPDLYGALTFRQYRIKKRFHSLCKR